MTLYWLSGTGGSSARYYREGSATWGEPETPSPVPVAAAVFPRDIAVPVRRLAEATNRIVRWTEFDRGGHFAAMEEPDLVVEDLQATFRPFRPADSGTTAGGGALPGGGVRPLPSGG